MIIVVNLFINFFRGVFEAECLLRTLFSIRMGAYKRWALIPGWAHTRIKMVRHFYQDC